ncbi:MULTISPECIES: TonB-dependent receptor [Sphingomonas]|uniref:TonB-dependent receptor n=1 Tax=Sphingomonas TaxID=13687 RepID=UPI0018DC25BA|nr:MULTISPECIES: TonB-dependent receptor [Sphingomonas]
MSAGRAAVAAILLLAPLTAAAAEALPATRLDRAVILLGKREGVSIGISDPTLAGLRTRPVGSTADVGAALGRMLAGTGAGAVRVGARSWRIVRLPAAPYPRARPAPAETPEPPGDEEIVVIASKRDTPLGRYSASVSIVDGEMAAAGLESLGTEALVAYLPSLTSTHLGPGRNKLFVRGLADSSFNGPTQATVGEYLGEARLNYNGPDPDLRLYDVRSVEVLEGPQGTLHGVGTLGGVIRLQPAPPNLERPEASLSSGVSFTEHGDPGADISAIIDLPLGDTMGLRTVAYRVREGGYIDDTLRGKGDVNRVDTVGGRAWLRFTPGGDWTIDLGGALQEIKGRDSQYADRDAPPLTKASPIAEGFASRYGLGQLVIRKSWGGLTLTSATSFARQRIRESFDASTAGDPTRFDQHARVDFFSNENRLVRNNPDGSGWVVGTSIVENRYALERSFAPIALAARLGGISNRIQEATAFGEGSVAIGDRLLASIGGRLTVLELSGSAEGVTSFAFARAAQDKASRREVALLPSLSLSWRPADGLLAYARYQQSFRPGGIVVRDAFVQRYRPDDVRAGEIGVRWEAPDETVRLSSALSYTSWRNIQADQVDAGGLPTTVNIGNGRIVTLDAKASVRPMPGLSLDLAGVLANSRLTRPALVLAAIVAADRSDLPNVARLNASAALRYGTALGAFDISFSAWARYVGRSRLGVGPILGQRQGEYVDTGLSLRATRGRYAIAATLTNLTGETGNRFALGSPLMLGHEQQVTPLRPRTLRIGFETAF